MVETDWTPPELLKMAGSYWSACTLHAGVKLDLFTLLSETPATAGDLSTQSGLSERGLTMLLDALASLDLLQKKKGIYFTTAFSSEFLSKTSVKYMGHIISHHHHLVESWSRLDVSVLSGKLVPQIDLIGRSHLLDLDGGPGTYTVHFCNQNPSMKATIYDLPATRQFAKETISRFSMQQRIDFQSGDFQDDVIVGQYDVAWLSHVLHGEGEEGCSNMLQKSVAALEPGGLLLVQEFILDEDRTKPVFPALFSLNMLLGTSNGKAYSEGEIVLLLQKAGLESVERLPIDLPNGAGVICGRRQ